jgi:hypothetical protein
MSDNKDKIEYRVTTDIPLPTAEDTQRMFDEAQVRTIIRAIQSNPALRRELREALLASDSDSESEV